MVFVYSKIRGPTRSKTTAILVTLQQLIATSTLEQHDLMLVRRDWIAWLFAGVLACEQSSFVFRDVAIVETI